MSEGSEGSEVSEFQRTGTWSWSDRTHYFWTGVDTRRLAAVGIANPRGGVPLAAVCRKVLFYYYFQLLTDTQLHLAHPRLVKLLVKHQKCDVSIVVTNTGTESACPTARIFSFDWINISLPAASRSATALNNGHGVVPKTRSKIKGAPRIGSPRFLPGPWLFLVLMTERSKEAGCGPALNKAPINTILDFF